MCGWAGFWGMDSANADELCLRAGRMADALTHRGPDDADEWADPDTGLALGFRRLAIVDLSPHGRQPMCSESGRYVIVYNGEVYNFERLRRQLLQVGHRFRGHSDTEVILAAIEQWGLEPALEQFVGMFAFALWDRRQRTLSLARDRLGIKPLYYGWAGKLLLFGSELKGLRAHPAFRPTVDRAALTLFLRYQYVPSPYCIYDGMRQLPPGHTLTVSSPVDTHARPRAYWSLRDRAEHALTHPFCGSEADAADQLEELLRDTVRLRMIADVPLGAFLSGGIDSSTVVALMQAQTPRPVKTFCVGFPEESFDEAPHARAVARRLGTDHTELYVTPAEAREVVPKLPQMYDEPFADSSQIPTFLVSRLARRDVTVSLSGDGGDELFGGYSRYLTGETVRRNLERVPASLRPPLARAMRWIKPETYDRGLGWLAPYLPAFGDQRMSGQRIHYWTGALAVSDRTALCRWLCSRWKSPTDVVVGGSEPPTAFTESARTPRTDDFIAAMMYLDVVSFLPDDILVKVDRASMAVGLEARVPILDHRVVEFAWRLPTAMKLKGGEGKWILRQVLYRYLPRELVDRPKKGFAVPIAAWLRGPLRGWAEDLLDESRLRQEGFLEPGPVRQRWEAHVNGVQEAAEELWGVLMFQAWLRRWDRCL